MKKINKFIASIVVFVVILSTFTIFVNADVSTPRGKMIVDHFGSLYGNPKISPNMNGSCAFVAMSMLLSYYDTYWNDLIVDENIEWGKGIYDSADDDLESTFNADDEFSDWDNYTGSRNDFVQNNKDKYLQSYLIDMCNRLPIIDELGVLAYQTQDVLQYYLYEDRSFNENQIKVHFYRAHNDDDKETMISIAQALIDDGHPVIFSGLATDIFGTAIDGDDTIIGGHSMIGYDYEGTPGNYDIVLNLCWNNSRSQKIRSTDFQSVNSIIWIEIIEENLPHECSDNYYNSADGTEYCACQVYYNTHPAHENNHMSISGNSGYNETNHWTNGCHCGEPGPDSVISLHNLSYTYIESSSTHIEECSDCGYSKETNHTYNQSVSVSDTHHVGACGCGATNSVQEEHVGSRYISANASVHGEYCVCGHLIGYPPHNMERINFRYSGCVDCGYIRDNNEVVAVIKKVDDVIAVCKE